MVSRFAFYLLQFIGRLPLGLRIFIGRSLGYLFALIPTRDRKIALLQMRLFLGSPQETEESKEACNKVSFLTLARVYANLGQTLVESLNLTPLLENCDKVVEADWALAESIINRGRGVITLTGHCGNWDFLAAYVAKKVPALSVIAKEARNSQLQEILRNIRQKNGVKTIWRAGRAGVRQLIEAIENKEIVAALIDQDTRVSSVMVPFFGQLAATPSSLVELAKKYDAAIVTAFFFRSGPGRYKMILKEIDSRLTTEQILTEYSKEQERVIRLYPDQWVWIHKRWRTLADGRRLSSAEYMKYLEARLREKRS